MADENAPAKPAADPQSLIPGDTPAQEGPSMGVSSLELRIYS